MLQFHPKTLLISLLIGSLMVMVGCNTTTPTIGLPDGKVAAKADSKPQDSKGQSDLTHSREGNVSNQDGNSNPCHHPCYGGWICNAATGHCQPPPAGSDAGADGSSVVSNRLCAPCSSDSMCGGGKNLCIMLSSGGFCGIDCSAPGSS